MINFGDVYKFNKTMGTYNQPLYMTVTAIRTEDGRFDGYCSHSSNKYTGTYGGNNRWFDNKTGLSEKGDWGLDLSKNYNEPEVVVPEVNLWVL